MKKLKIALIVLIVILLSLISFGGVYYKNKNEMSNCVPNYALATDLKGYRQVKLDVKKTSNSDQETSDENSEEKSENKEEVNYTADDYKKSAQVLRSRLKSLKVENYTVSCDENTGMINVTLPENDQTDIILSDITQKGEFAIKDASSKENLLTNSDVSKVEVGKREVGSISQTYMDIHFTTSGASKFKGVTKEYQNRVDDNTATNTNATENTDTADSNQEEENSSKDEETEDADTQEKKEETSKQIELDIDGNTMMTTDFSEVIDNGLLSLSLGSSTMADEDTNALYSAYNLGAIIENDPMPVEYEVSSNSFVASVIKENQTQAIIYVEIGIGLVLLLALIIKYRLKGIIASVLSVGYIAILLIVIRYANVPISLQGFFAIAVAFITNYALTIKCIEYTNKEDLSQNEKSSEFKKLLKQATIIAIPELVVAVICCFTQWEPLLSLGMIIFWGIVISLIYNIIATKFIDE